MGRFKTNFYSKPAKQVPNSMSSQKEKRSRSPFREKPNPATEGRLPTRCPHLKISAHCFLKPFKEAWRQMPVFPFGSFLVLSSNRNTCVAWAHRSVYQKEEYLIMPDSGKIAFRGKKKNHSTCGETTLRS